MNPAAPGPRTGRPVTAPAYYLGRPASVWMAVACRRADLVLDGDAASQQAADVDRIGAAAENKRRACRLTSSSVGRRGIPATHIPVKEESS